MRIRHHASRHADAIISVLLVTVMIVGAYGNWAAAAVSELISISSSGTQGSQISNGGSLSTNARFVVFNSDAPEFVSDDTNGAGDVFVRDRLSGNTLRASIASDGTQGNGASTSGVISADGKYVAFSSIASNLVLGDTNGKTDIFLHDLTTNVTTLISTGFGGAQASDSSASPAISASGRFVAFQSNAANIVVGDMNNSTDIFVADTATGEIIRANLTSGGAETTGGASSPSMSADGRYVAFQSSSPDLVAGYSGRLNIYVRDLLTGTTEVISKIPGGGQANGNSLSPSLSGDGRYVGFTSYASDIVPGDTTAFEDVFVYDRQTGITVLASVLSDGSQLDAQKSRIYLSDDGRYVSYSAYDQKNPDGSTTYSRSSIYVRDMAQGISERLTYALDGSLVNGNSSNRAISGDGKFVTYQSFASNIVPSDLNGVSDVFLAQNPLYAQMVNHPPILVVVEDQVTIEGAPLSFTVSVSDPDGDLVSIAPDALPAGASFDPLTGVFAWTPAVGQTGVYNVRFTATDNGNPPESSGVDVRITVNEDESNRPGELQVLKTVFGGDATFSFTGPEAIGHFDITTIGSVGSATFSGLAAGSYIITEAPQPGWVQVDSTCDSEDEPGSEVSGGETAICTITNAALGRIIVKQVVEGGRGTFGYAADYNDGFSITNNGSHDSGLIDPSVVGTDAFAGEHSVTQEEADGWTTQESCDNGDNPDSITLYPGQTITCTFINMKTKPSKERGSISGVKFEDKNGNGVQESGEKGLPGFAIYLDTNKNGVREKGERVTVTRKNGTFTFNKVPAGTYTVREKEKKNWVLTTPASGSHIVTLIGGAKQTGITFGNFRKGMIAGFVFEDKDRNGKKNGKDRRLSGWTVQLYKDGVLIGAAQTGKGGGYRFKDLGPGTYTLREGAQIGWQQTTADPSPIPLTSRENYTRNVFGNTKI